MNELPRYYTILFNAVEDAVAAMERMDFGTAKSMLVRGQILAEEAYLAQAQTEKEKKE